MASDASNVHDLASASRSELEQLLEALSQLDEHLPTDRGPGLIAQFGGTSDPRMWEVFYIQRYPGSHGALTWVDDALFAVAVPTSEARLGDGPDRLLVDALAEQVEWVAERLGPPQSSTAGRHPSVTWALSGGREIKVGVSAWTSITLATARMTRLDGIELASEDM